MRKHSICQYCSGPIPPHAWRSARYCSPEHARAARLDQWRNRSTTDAQAEQQEKKRKLLAPASAKIRILCVVCNGPLPAKASNNRKTCSPQCLAVHRRSYIRNYHNQIQRDPDALEQFQAQKRRSSNLRSGRARLKQTKEIINDRYRRE